MIVRVLAALLFLSVLTGCPEADVIPDTGPKDTGFKDAAPVDMGQPDLGVPDSGDEADAEPPDAIEPDAEPLDALPNDADLDGGEVDGGEELDAGEEDIGTPDAGGEDVPPGDVGVPPPAPIAVGTLAFTKILALSATPAVDALEITNVSTTAVRLDGLVLRVQSAGGGDLAIFAANDPTGAAQVPVVLLAGSSATGIANRGVNATADFLIGAPNALAEDFLPQGDEIEVANASGAAIDSVDFTATATAGEPGANDFPLVVNAPVQLDLEAVTSSAATLNDDGARWCVDLAAGQPGVHTDCDRFLINELLYDFDSIAAGEDQGREFIEIAGPIGGSLADVVVTAVEGTGATAGAVDGEFPLGLSRMPVDDGFFVIADEDLGATLVANADLVVDLDLENGPDAVQLVFAPTGGTPVLLDAIAYGVVTALVDLVRGLPIGEGAPTSDPGPTIYPIDFARIAFADTDDNLTDFTYDPSPSPGADNGFDAFNLFAVAPNRAPAGSAVQVTFTGNDFTDQMTVTFAQTPPPTITCAVPTAINTLVCTVTYPAAGTLVGEAVDVTVAARPELGTSVTFSGGFIWVGANNETDTGPECDFCNLQFPGSTSTPAGTPTPTIYGQIYEAGLTDVTTGGPAPGILVELGYGPVGSDPRTSAAWIWTATTFNTETGPGGNNDEYQGTLTVPVAGSYLYTHRYSLDGGLNFSYGDLDGAGSNGGLDFSLTQLGTLTVN